MLELKKQLNIYANPDFETDVDRHLSMVVYQASVVAQSMDLALKNLADMYPDGVDFILSEGFHKTFYWSDILKYADAHRLVVVGGYKQGATTRIENKRNKGELKEMSKKCYILLPDITYASDEDRLKVGITQLWFFCNYWKQYNDYNKLVEEFPDGVEFEHGDKFSQFVTWDKIKDFCNTHEIRLTGRGNESGFSVRFNPTNLKIPTK